MASGINQTLRSFVTPDKHPKNTLLRPSRDLAAINIRIACDIAQTSDKLIDGSHIMRIHVAHAAEQ